MLRTTNAPKARRGVSLLMAVVVLASFMIAGIFALAFTKDQAEVARIQRATGSAAADLPLPDDGLVALNTFLSAFIYDVPDTGTGLGNPLRGHSLVASMYG